MKRPASAVLLIAVAACSRGGPVEVDSSEEVGGGPKAFALAHATYSGIMNEPVTLTGGQWEGEPFVKGGASRPTVGLVEDFVLTGDLNNDGRAEAAVLLWASSGGSGNRLYLAVGTGVDVITNLGTALIGDRVQVRSGVIDAGRVTLDIIRAGPGDPACCPTEKALVTWVLSEVGLTQIADETAGTLSLADLGGHEWFLLRSLGRGQPLPGNVEISLLFMDDRVSGSSGCNNYFAGVAAPNPGELRFNGMGATRMACPETVMDLERRYLRILAGASSYHFLPGRLVLRCDTAEGPQALVFSPQGDSTGTLVGAGK